MNKRVIMIGLNYENFQNFISKPKLSFLMNEFNMCIFLNFSRKYQLSEWSFHENRENHIMAEFVNIREFILVMIFVIFPQK